MDIQGKCGIMVGEGGWGGGGKGYVGPPPKLLGTAPAPSSFAYVCNLEILEVCIKLSTKSVLDFFSKVFQEYRIRNFVQVL